MLVHALLCLTDATVPPSLHYPLPHLLRTSAICNSLAAAWMACGGMRPVGPMGAALAGAGARLPFLAAGGMEAAVAMEPRLALLPVAAMAAPLPPPFFIARACGCRLCVCEEGEGEGGGEAKREGDEEVDEDRRVGSRGRRQGLAAGDNHAVLLFVGRCGCVGGQMAKKKSEGGIIIALPPPLSSSLPSQRHKPLPHTPRRTPLVTASFPSLLSLSLSPSSAPPHHRGTAQSRSSFHRHQAGTPSLPHHATQPQPQPQPSPTAEKEQKQESQSSDVLFLLTASSPWFEGEGARQQQQEKRKGGGGGQGQG